MPVDGIGADHRSAGGRTGFRDPLGPICTLLWEVAVKSTAKLFGSGSGSSPIERGAGE